MTNTDLREYNHACVEKQFYWMRRDHLDLYWFICLCLPSTPHKERYWMSVKQQQNNLRMHSAVLIMRIIFNGDNLLDYI